jgi:excalibur calcium-binding domain
MKTAILILTLAAIPFAHEEAQRYHDERGGNTSLDRDKDGEACECLEGGSAHGSPRCNH